MERELSTILMAKSQMKYGAMALKSHTNTSRKKKHTSQALERSKVQLALDGSHSLNFMTRRSGMMRRTANALFNERVR